MYVACVDTGLQSEEVDGGDQDLHMLFDRVTGNLVRQDGNLGNTGVHLSDAVRVQAQAS